MGFLIRTLVTAVALWVATALLSGIELTGSNSVSKVLTLIAVAIIFGLVNAVLKPIVKIFGCVFYILTLGLFALVVNALLFLLVSWICDLLKLPFHVDRLLGRVLGRHHRRRRQLADQPRHPGPAAAGVAA